MSQVFCVVCAPRDSLSDDRMYIAPFESWDAATEWALRMREKHPGFEYTADVLWPPI